MPEQKTDQDKLSGIVRRAWRDPAFKSQLLASPRDVLAMAGIDIPDGVTIEVHENDAGTVHLVLPSPPRQELSEEELEDVAGGYERVLRGQLPN